ncbi:MAG: CaiB/BaiF CoA-transferase family protein [Myxococcota bacterium]|jgi:crotonobetainyl-CoA:carnitine CoA-transferase CaiB-like acyl-CoA transferase|nr:CaiB/BaiF CoA-transferase family protein [Myxococcota bacterium]
MNGPLDGYTVIDLSQAVSGPLATMILADQGADVIKVEPTTGIGDFVRIPSYMKGGLNAWFMNLNRGKRSLSLDLTKTEGQELVIEMCKQADVFVQNFRPGAIERMGLGYDVLSAVNPDLVYVSISGFGPTGPYADRPVLDPVIQATCGMIDRQLNPLIPIPDIIRNVVADKSTSLTVSQAVVAALLARERGHGGQHIGVSMLDAAMYFFWSDGMMDHTLLDDDVSPGRLLSTIYSVTECRDGKIVYFAGNEKQRLGVCEAVGHPEWAEDERFATIAALASNPDNYALFGEMLADAFAEMGAVEATEALIRNEVPAGPVLTAEQAISDPQVVHSGTLVEWQHPHAGTVRQPRPAAVFSKTPTTVPECVPLRGEQNDEILSQFGFDSERVDELRGAKVVG